MKMSRRFLILSVCIGLLGCGSDAPRDSGSSSSADPAAAPPRVTRPQIVALGDSLTAGLGLAPDEAYPAVLQRRLDRAGYDFEVVNAGVSGDTSAGGLRRLEWALGGDVRVLIVALGGNDALRGLPPGEMQRNLEAIVAGAEARGVAVVLAGMEAPPNYGPEYTVEFRQVFRDLAQAHDLVFVPFLLHGVAGIPAMNQADGIHPNARGAEAIADLLWPALEPLIRGSATS